MSWFIDFFFIFNVFIFIYVVFVDCFYLLLFLLSLKQLNVYLKRVPYSEYEELSISENSPPISIIVPSYNEEHTIKDSVISFLQINYPEYEIIVVNDDSKDQTLDILKENFVLMPIEHFAVRTQLRTKQVRAIYRSTKYPSLIVIDKENGGKADALNAGINVSTYPYFCGVDADSLLEPSSLTKAMKPFFEDGEDIVACGGIIRIANGCKIENGYVKEVRLPTNIFALHQVIEYLRSFLMGRLGLSSLNNLLIISGAFGIFRKQEVLNIGGYSTNTVGEDMELVVKLQKYLYQTKSKAKVLFVPDPVCWTEAPENATLLFRQRTRWHIGLMETLIKHRELIFNPRYKIMGLFAMPYFLFVELLGPTIELVGTILFAVGLLLDLINVPFAILFFIFTFVYGIFLSIGAVLLEEYSFRRYASTKDLWKLFFFSIFENFWYRQMNAFFRTWAFFRFLKKDTKWGAMERKGFANGKRQQFPM